MNQNSDPILDSPTADVIEFLAGPGSEFGTELDNVEALRTSETLADQLRLRLEIQAGAVEIPERQRLRERLRGYDFQLIDWQYVLQELRVRLRLTNGFFSQDLPASENTSKTSPA